MSSSLNIKDFKTVFNEEAFKRYHRKWMIIREFEGGVQVHTHCFSKNQVREIFNIVSRGEMCETIVDTDIHQSLKRLLTKDELKDIKITKRIKKRRGCRGYFNRPAAALHR